MSSILPLTMRVAGKNLWNSTRSNNEKTLSVRPVSIAGTNVLFLTSVPYAKNCGWLVQRTDMS